ncbi:MAG: hypothetical protein AAGH60_08385 [Pseudomonadota bacterium]
MTDAVSLAQSVIPDNVKQSWFKSLLGSVMGQAVMLLITVLAYLGVLLALNQAMGGVQGLQTSLGRWFWPVVVSPILVIVFGLVLPAALKARRENRLKQLSIKTDTRLAGVFRTTPLTRRDAEGYSRADGAHEEAISWVSGTSEPLLYLTGASGTGKSSLVEASLLPRLEAAGWTTVTIRFDRDAAERLQEALVEQAGLWKSPPEDTDVSSLLLLADAKATKSKKRVLIVIDQFEEFLILNDDEQVGPIVEAMRKFSAEGSASLLLLAVFRSDYGPLLFKQGLPASVEGKNCLALAPFSRPEAEAFLKAGGRELSDSAYDRLFRGLDKIEGTKGLYRPITLNMIGLVLDRMGDTLDTEPEKLIDAYLRSHLIEGDTKDHAAIVAGAMITDAGTKLPVTVPELVSKTGRADWQVQATLADLSPAGLVRQIAGGTWEIAHDFLARQIGTLLGRLKPSLWTRAARVAPALSVVLVVLWAGSAGYFTTVQWPLQRERQALETIADLGFSRAKSTTDAGEAVEIFTYGGLGVTNDDLARFVDEVRFVVPADGPVELVIEGPTQLTSVEPLSSLQNLSRLRIAHSNRISSLEPLAELSNLHGLDLTGSDGFRSLEPLSNLTNLQNLTMAYTTEITSLQGLSGLTSLQSLDLTEARGIISLQPLSGLVGLKHLRLRNADRVRSLLPLSGLTGLWTLDLSGSDGITSLAPLSRLTGLQSLDLSDADNITSLEPLSGLTSLRTLDLWGGPPNLSLAPLALMHDLEIHGASAAQEKTLRAARALLDASQ